MSTIPVSYYARLPFGKAEVTTREKKVILGIVEGKTNKQIGKDLGISHRIVQYDIGKVSRRLGFNSREQLAVLALKEGWVEPTPIDPDIRISPREESVIKLVAEGFSNKQIGASLEISEFTVKKHLDRLYVRLGFRCRSQLVSLAFTAPTPL